MTAKERCSMLLPMNGDILPPSDDYIFKTLLTHPDTRPALIDLLSAIIGREVKEVQIRNNELPVTDADEKAERLDVNCVVENGDHFSESRKFRYENKSAHGGRGTDQ